MKKVFLTFTALSLVFVSCKKETDETAPTLSNVMIDGATSKTVAAGGSFTVTASIADDVELGQVKVDIHDAFDGHEHKSFVRFSQVDILDISGTSHSLSHNVTLPAGANSGPYHVIVQAIDAEGNESALGEVSLTITNSGQPVVNATNPDLTQSQAVTPGSTWSLNGTVTDDIDIAEIEIKLEEEGDHDHKSTPLFDADFDLTGSSDTSWDFQNDGNLNIAIPSNADGHFVLIIKVLDSDGNMTVFESEEVHIH